MSDAAAAAQPTTPPPEEEVQTISDDYKSTFPPHEQEKLDRLRDAGPDVMAKSDAIVIEGMNAFFNNEFAKADLLFRQTYKDDPLCASAWGTLGSMKAMLSFSGPDIEFASNQLIYSAAFGNGVQPKGEGIVKGLSNWWKGKTKRLTPFQLRALLVVAEAELLRANVLLIQDTMTGYLKAGLALRRGYNIYDRLQKYVAEFKDDHGVDANTMGGIHFGLGSIHVVTSVLPPKIYAVLKALGYMHDRDVGMVHLQQCLKSRTLRSPLASLLLLAFHGILPSFAPLTMERHIPMAEQVIAETLTMYPKSMIHLWLSGRVARLKRDTAGAIAIFNDCVTHGKGLREALPQLEHFALYDLAWAYMSQCDWLSAFHCFRRLEVESNWSKMFYTYAQAACLDMLAVDAAIDDDNACAALLEADPSENDALSVEAADKISLGTNDEADAERKAAFAAASPSMRVAVCRILARRLLQRSMGCASFKVGGKIISIEQFVKRRLKQKLNFVKTPQQTEAVDRAKELSEEEIARMSVGDDAEHDDERMKAQDACPLRLVTGIELASHFNVFVQTEAKDLDRLRRYCTFFDKHVMARADSEDVAVVQLVRAQLGLVQKDEACAELLQELIDAPAFENEKWIQPYALYGKGLWLYETGDAAASREVLTKTIHKRFGGKDYNFEMQMNFRLHLTADMFKQDDKDKAEKEKAAGGGAKTSSSPAPAAADADATTPVAATEEEDDS